MTAAPIFRFERTEWKLEEEALAIEPAVNEANVYYVLTSGGGLVRIHTADRSQTVVYTIREDELDISSHVSIILSPLNDFAAVTQTYGRHGVVIDLRNPRVSMAIERDDYHSEQSIFPAAFFVDQRRTLFIHGTKWNRLELSDPSDGKLLTERLILENRMDEETFVRAEHDLDYFHGQLLVSPDQRWVADNGWEWHPAGSVVSWNLASWLGGNPYESEDGPSRRTLWWGKYEWNDAMCWIDAHAIGIAGQLDEGIFDKEDEPALYFERHFRSYDVRDGKLLQAFKIQEGQMFYDDNCLFTCSEADGFIVYDMTGNLRYHDKSMRVSKYQSVSKTFAGVRGNTLTMYTRVQEVQ
ncbi:hypothetical protein GZH47_30740 [Paenibacillus rhizovicinus]|uniref:WD40 repeat domain-containing protein n=1 Tax=Paenibacillus rhizovicinus TaxID=2704463 RepID=A0A6C0PAR2_9BACL|nr:hypothetical protein [Paenibacillus rhizovicinus]QHW34743.1 hypothetical protein GZH47_30740 [Paenibacillus rhizovicinus]